MIYKIIATALLAAQAASGAVIRRHEGHEDHSHAACSTTTVYVTPGPSDGPVTSGSVIYVIETQYTTVTPTLQAPAPSSGGDLSLASSVAPSSTAPAPSSEYLSYAPSSQPPAPSSGNLSSGLSSALSPPTPGPSSGGYISYAPSSQPSAPTSGSYLSYVPSGAPYLNSTTSTPKPPVPSNPGFIGPPIPSLNISTPVAVPSNPAFVSPPVAPSGIPTSSVAAETSIPVPTPSNPGSAVPSGPSSGMGPFVYPTRPGGPAPAPGSSEAPIAPSAPLRPTSGEPAPSQAPASSQAPAPSPPPSSAPQQQSSTVVVVTPITPSLPPSAPPVKGKAIADDVEEAGIKIPKIPSFNSKPLQQAGNTLTVSVIKTMDSTETAPASTKTMGSLMSSTDLSRPSSTHEVSGSPRPTPTLKASSAAPSAPVKATVIGEGAHCPYPYPGEKCGNAVTTVVTETAKPLASEAEMDQKAKATGWCPYPGQQC